MIRRLANASVTPSAKLWIPAVLTLLVAACQEAGNPPGAESEEVSSAFVDLTANPAQGMIELTYEFEPAVREFSFRYRAGAVRGGSWDLLDPEFVLESESVRRAGSELFKRVRIVVKTDADWYDRVFPALRPVGESGLVFNTHYLTLEDIQLESIRARVVPGHVIAWSDFAYRAGALDHAVHDLPVDRWHYVFFGKDESIRPFAGGVIVSDAESSSRVLELLRAGVGPAVEWLEVFLRLEPVGSVHVIATVDEGSKDNRWRGDVSASGELFLRFFGDGWNAVDEERDRIIESFRTHELVHALTNRSFQVADDEPEWLWEGLAEYLALVYEGHYEKTPDPVWFGEEIRQRASACMGKLEETGVGISHPTMLRGAGPYDCGVLVYWLLDGAPQSVGVGDGLRTVWSAVTEGFAANNPEYGVADLLAAAGATGSVEALQSVELLLQGPAGSDWQERDLLLSELGVVVTYEYDDAWDARARSAIVDHMLDLHCLPGRRGYWTYGDYIRLDTGDRCGPLSGDPRIDRIAGLSLFGGMRAVFDSVEAGCRKGGYIQLGIFESPDSLTVECTAPIREVPPSAILTAREQH